MMFRGVLSSTDCTRNCSSYCRRSGRRPASYARLPPLSPLSSAAHCRARYPHLPPRSPLSLLPPLSLLSPISLPHFPCCPRFPCPHFPCCPHLACRAYGLTFPTVPIIFYIIRDSSNLSLVLRRICHDDDCWWLCGWLNTISLLV